MSPNKSPRFGISKHFRREATIMVGLFILFLVLSLIAGILGPLII